MKKEKLFQDLSIEDKLFVLQMAIKIFNLEDVSLAEKINENNPLSGFAKKIAIDIAGDEEIKKSGKSLIVLNSTMRTIAEFKNVSVKIPLHPYLSPGRCILTLDLKILDVPYHFYYGYILKKLPGGGSTPAVYIHFFNVPEEKFGAKVIGDIEVKLQKDACSERRKMVIDFVFKPAETKANWTLLNDRALEDKMNEFIVPEIPGKCIRIKPILKKVRLVAPKIASLGIMADVNV